MQLVYFKPPVLELQEELLHPEHSALMEILNQNAEEDWEIRLSQICTYCGVALDDWYDEADILRIMEVCTAILYKRRSKIILLN